jgi:Spy/CpxP family protein refolding chaperone
MKAFILAALAAPALLVGAHKGHHGSHADFHAEVVRRLDLSKDQQAALHRVFEAHHPALRADAAAMAHARAEMVHTVLDPASTEAQIRVLEAKGAEADLALELELNRTMKDVDPILSAEQKAKAHALMGELHGRLHEHLHGFLGEGASCPEKATR